ncbi:hypothetical protein DL95DRAFT_105502 [Leptodontidium sp. 2 PMI_412]|nr:hypothetical protein DL95DRAFT_105502 [Leptodontidium sp. 2 PMI_412]
MPAAIAHYEARSPEKPLQTPILVVQPSQMSSPIHQDQTSQAYHSISPLYPSARKSPRTQTSTTHPDHYSPPPSTREPSPGHARVTATPTQYSPSSHPQLLSQFHSSSHHPSA